MNSVDKNVSSVQFQQSESHFKKPVSKECCERVAQLIASKTVNDTFFNCNIDLSSCKDLIEKDNARAAKDVLAHIIETETKNLKHMLTLKLAPTQTRLHKYALENGMSIHHADPESSWIVKCMKNHDASKCNYPKFKTASVGISGIVFNHDLTKFLAVKEVSGPYRGWKSPTGAVDYEKGENPLEAVTREISEETNLKLDSNDALYVGTAWTKNFRGNSPDINYAFAFKCTDQTQKLRAQEEEISKVEWISYQEFMNSPANIPNEKTFIIKAVVEAAYKVLNEKSGWHSKDLNWGSGKPVTLLSNL